MRSTRFRRAAHGRLRASLAALAMLAASAGALVAQAVPASAATAATLYVSPGGTGTACSAGRPCSLTQAKADVRAIDGSMTGDIVVQVADGTYRLTSPLTFTAADSGTGGYSVIWKAALGARPVITGAGSSTGYVVLVATPGQGIVLSWDSDGDGYLDTNAGVTGNTAIAPVWLRLVRNGTSVTGSYSADGTTWTTVGTATLTGADNTEDAGVFFTAHGGTPGTASFSQFSAS